MRLRLNRIKGQQVRRTLARFGLVGLAFFTIKGLLWLLVPALLAAGAVGVAQ